MIRSIIENKIQVIESRMGEIDKNKVSQEAVTGLFCNDGNTNRERNGKLERRKEEPK